MLLRGFVQVGGPAIALESAHVAVAGELRAVGRQIAGGDDRARAQPRRQRLERRACDVRYSEFRARELGDEDVGNGGVDGDAIRARVGTCRFDRVLVEVAGENRIEAELPRGDGQDTRAATEVDEAAPAGVE